MKVTVTAATSFASNRTRVHFVSSFGEAVGIWEGVPPTLGATYDVELDAPHTLQWGTDISLIETREDVIETVDDLVVIRGAPLSVEEDGTMALNVGGSVLLFDTEGGPAAGSRLEVRVPELHLRDTNL